MVERTNLGPDDASIMRCAVARRCIQLGYRASDGMVHIDAVNVGQLGDDASFRNVRGQTCYSDMKLGSCLQLPEFAPYFEVVPGKGNPWVSLQFHALVPSPSSIEEALLSKLSGIHLANGSSHSHFDRLSTPQPAATASASKSADLQRPAPADLRTCGADSTPGTHPSCQVHEPTGCIFMC